MSHQEITKHKEERENFDNFFSKFRSDSSFRLSRTKFPLDGYNSDEKEIDSRDTLYVWSKEDFNFYAEEDFKKQISINIKEHITKSDSLVFYRRYIEDSGYNINYKFNIISGNWYLVCYSYKNY
ncbi:hypothetical protein [Flavobacterium sp. NRK1]|uniref:hypothetical protein n=1 Tax=Flavobacterium sp. NRK1 TaxID=2954929 RepID=UPI0035B00F5B